MLREWDIGAELRYLSVPELHDAERGPAERRNVFPLTLPSVAQFRMTRRIEGMAAAVRKVAALRDPVGNVIAGWVLPNGLKVDKVRVPIGVVLANARLAQERDYWLLRQLKALRQEIDVYVMAEAISEEEARTVIRRGAAGVSQTGKLPDLLKRDDTAPGE